ncbi:hypothetical protein NSY02_001222 [Enterococcus hirae]|nr:hypothetical protein [Enterococcus hirae]
MKKNNKLKILGNVIFTLLFVVSLIYSVIKILSSFKSNDLSSIYDTLASTVSFAFGYGLYIYNNSNNIFFWVNRCRARYSRETVGWEISYNTILKSKEDILSATENLTASLKKSGKIRKDLKREESRIIEFEDKDLIVSEFNLRYDEVQDNRYKLFILFKSQTSHRDVLKQWKFYRKVIDETFCDLIQVNNNKTKPHEEKSYYTVSLRMDKNPFYLLTIKTYDQPQDIKFNLKFSVDGVKFNSTNNKITIVTEDNEKVEGVLKNYVLLGKVT